MNDKQLELELLYLWNHAGVVEIYKCGNAIKWYEPDKKLNVQDRTLFLDFRGLFKELSVKEHGMISEVKEVYEMIKERI